MKNKTTAALLAFFLGGIGGHKFYLNRPVEGFIYLIFSCTLIPAIIGFIEGIIYLCMSDYSFNLKYNEIPIQTNSNNIYLSLNQNLAHGNGGYHSQQNNTIYENKNILPKTQSEAFYFILIKTSQLDGEVTKNEYQRMEVVLKLFFNDKVLNMTTDENRIKPILHEDTFVVIDKCLEFIDDNENLLKVIIEFSNKNGIINEEIMNIIRYISKKSGMSKNVYTEIINNYK
ncbi:TM2 domain-containing protein [Apibacter adventoris]|uniref:TM2 domain-containing protein n=1 Tax=Apibacter adventoris TaxID=1679466 RepID=A0A2S8AFG0_9FLAO|nr:TM2 domain-containing protein [Apibacter adventoris]PQL93997.1 hypothetical protein C4S76_06390 [Apibacter adventoris]PQL94873.1 hypothetical protein C4S77_02510 [Apibacter adventoris]